MKMRKGWEGRMNAKTDPATLGGNRRTGEVSQPFLLAPLA